MTDTPDNLKYDPMLESFIPDTTPYSVEDLISEVQYTGDTNMLERLSKKQLIALGRSVKRKVKANPDNYFNKDDLKDFLQVFLSCINEKDTLKLINDDNFTIWYKKNKYRPCYYTLTVLEELDDRICTNLLESKQVKKTTSIHELLKLIRSEHERLQGIDKLSETILNVFKYCDVSMMPILSEPLFVPMEVLLQIANSEIDNMTKAYALAKVIYDRKDNKKSKTDIADMMKLNRRVI